MTLLDFYHHLVDLGWPGIALILVVMGAGGLVSGLVLRLLHRKGSLRRFSWADLGTAFLSTLLLLLSGIWSGWAKYLERVEADPVMAAVSAAGFIVIGLVVSCFVNICGRMAQRESGLSRVIPVFVMVFFSMIWLCISPLYNARFLCSQEVMRSEIALRFVELDRYSEPIISRYTIYRTKIVPVLVGIHEALLAMAEEQRRPELGGCGPICQHFEEYGSLLRPTVQRLYLAYDPDDPEKDLRGKVHRIRNDIMGLINSKDITAQEMKQDFYDRVSRWSELLFTANIVDSPDLALNKALASLDTLLVYLKDFRVNQAESPIRSRAVDKALATLEPLVGDLKLVFGSRGQNPAMRPVSLRNSELHASRGYSLASIAEIELTPVLLRKHFGQLWPDILLSYSLDLFGLGFVYVPMLVAFFRRRPVQAAIAGVKAKKDARARAEYRLRAIERELASVSDNIDARKRKVAARLDRLRKEHERTVGFKCRRVERELAGVADQKKECRARLEQTRLSVKKKEREVLAKAVSADEEAVIRARHQLYIDNAEQRADEELAALRAREDALSAELGNLRKQLDEKFEKKQRAANREDELLVRKMERQRDDLVKRRLALVSRVEDTRRQLEEAEAELADLRND